MSSGLSPGAQAKPKEGPQAPDGFAGVGGPSPIRVANTPARRRAIRRPTAAKRRHLGRRWRSVTSPRWRSPEAAPLAGCRDSVPAGCGQRPQYLYCRTPMFRRNEAPPPGNHRPPQQRAAKALPFHRPLPFRKREDLRDLVPQKSVAFFDGGFFDSLRLSKRVVSRSAGSRRGSKLLRSGKPIQAIAWPSLGFACAPNLSPLLTTAPRFVS